MDTLTAELDTAAVDTLAAVHSLAVADRGPQDADHSLERLSHRLG